MDDVWTANTGDTPVLASGYFTLGNGVIHKTLPVTATQNFELKADVLHGAYSRSLWVGLFNSTGTQGHAFLWNSGTVPNGVVRIKKHTAAGPASLLFNTYRATLGSGLTRGVRRPTARSPSSSSPGAGTAPPRSSTSTWMECSKAP